MRVVNKAFERFGHNQMSLIVICQMLLFSLSTKCSDLSVDLVLVGSIIGFKFYFFSLEVTKSGRFGCFMTLYL